MKIKKRGKTPITGQMIKIDPYLNLDPVGKMKKDLDEIKNAKIVIPYQKITIHVPIWDEEALFVHRSDDGFTVRQLLLLFRDDYKEAIAKWVYPKHPEIFSIPSTKSEAISSIGENAVTNIRIMLSGHIYFDIEH